MGLSQDKDSTKETCVGVIKTIAADEFASAIRDSFSAVRSVFKLTNDIRRKVEKLTPS